MVNPDEVRGQVLLEESREAVVVLDENGVVVTASGRNVRPLATALALLLSQNPTLRPIGAIQTGMCRHPRTSWPERKSAGTQVNCAPAVVTALMP